MLVKYPLCVRHLLGVQAPRVNKTVLPAEAAKDRWEKQVQSAQGHGRTCQVMPVGPKLCTMPWEYPERRGQLCGAAQGGDQEGLLGGFL